MTYVMLSVLHSFYPLFRAQVLRGCTVSSLRFRGFNPAFPLFLFVVFSAINRFLRIFSLFLVHTAYLLFLSLPSLAHGIKQSVDPPEVPHGLHIGASTEFPNTENDESIPGPC